MSISLCVLTLSFTSGCAYQIHGHVESDVLPASWVHAISRAQQNVIPGCNRAYLDKTITATAKSHGTRPLDFTTHRVEFTHTCG